MSIILWILCFRFGYCVQVIVYESAFQFHPQTSPIYKEFSINESLFLFKNRCAVFFMIIKGMYTIKEAPGFEKKRRPLLLPSGLWSVDGLEIFFGQFMRNTGIFFSSAHPSLFKSLSFHLFTVKYAKYIRKYIGTIFYIQCTHNKVPSMGLTPCDNA